MRCALGLSSLGQTEAKQLASVSLGGLWQPRLHLHKQKEAQRGGRSGPGIFCTHLWEGVGGKGLQD